MSASPTITGSPYGEKSRATFWAEERGGAYTAGTKRNAGEHPQLRGRMGALYAGNLLNQPPTERKAMSIPKELQRTPVPSFPRHLGATESTLSPGDLPHQVNTSSDTATVIGSATSEEVRNENQVLATVLATVARVAHHAHL